MSTTFHPFPRLPVELRIVIWGLTLEPRTVDVRAVQGSRSPRGHSRYGGVARACPDPFTPVPVPGVMHACRESRDQELYEKVPYTSLSVPPEERYAWINFDMDMIDLEQGHLVRIMHLKNRIRRLKLERCNGDEYWYYDESPSMVEFGKLEVCHVVALNGLEIWYTAWEDTEWTCTKGNLKFIDKKTGRMLDANELEQMMEDDYAEEERVQAEAERV